MPAPAQEGSMDWLPTDETDLNEAAALYAIHGFAVVVVWGLKEWGEHPVCACGLPVCKPGKHPIHAQWQKRATTDPDAARDARRRHPKANIGVATGLFIVVDLDGDAGRASWDELQSIHGEVGATLATKTGRKDGGIHLWFALQPHQDPKRLRNRGAMCKGIDVRATGGQVLVPPSRHESGELYRWAVRMPPLPLPDWLYAMIADVPGGHREDLGGPAADRVVRARPVAAGGRVVSFSANYLEAVINRAARDCASAPQGERNHRLFAKACTVFEYLVGEGVEPAEARARMRRAGLACGSRPPRGGRHALQGLEAGPEKPQASAPAHDARGGGRHPHRGHGADAGQRRGPWRLGGGPRRWGQRCSAAGELEDEAGEGVPEASDPDAWRDGLLRDAKANVKTTPGNLLKILRHGEPFRGRFVRNVMTLTTLVDARPLEDEILVHLQEQVEDAYSLSFSQAATTAAVLGASAESPIHPLRDWLEALAWDGEPRIVRVLTRVLGIRVPLASPASDDPKVVHRRRGEGIGAWVQG